MHLYHLWKTYLECSFLWGRSVACACSRTIGRSSSSRSSRTRCRLRLRLPLCSVPSACLRKRSTWQGRRYRTYPRASGLEQGEHSKGWAGVCAGQGADCLDRWGWKTRYVCLYTKRPIVRSSNPVSLPLPGWAEGGPYNAIHVGAAAPTLPQPLVDQLARPGRMFIPVGMHSQAVLQVDKHEDGSVTKKELFGVRVRPFTQFNLPSFS